MRVWLFTELESAKVPRDKFRDFAFPGSQPSILALFYLRELGGRNWG